jgi:hypothetical protein
VCVCVVECECDKTQAGGHFTVVAVWAVITVVLLGTGYWHSGRVCGAAGLNVAMICVCVFVKRKMAFLCVTILHSTC